MRPPVPSLNLSRRAKIALWVAAIIIVLIIAFVQLAGVYVNWLWFDSLGFRSVYATVFWTRFTLFLIFGVLMALIIGGNIVIAYLLAPPFRPMSAEQQNIERYRAVLEPRRWLVLAAISLIALFSAGLSAQGNWAAWQLWLHGGSFGVKDPQFGLDISFYAWDYPVYRILLGFGFTAIIFSIILSAVVHYLSGAIRLQTPGPKVTLAARRHLTILVFVFVVLKALAYWLDRYGLVFSDRSTFTGASYTDVHAVLPSRTILFWIAVVIAVGLIVSLWLRSTLLPAIAFVSMLVLSILISGIYPAILQQVSVKPNASSKEAPYISRNIQATRDAYDIKTKDDVTYLSYDALANPSTTAITPANPTISDIRILDPNVLTQTFTQLQQIKQQYGFPNKLDMDRYPLGDTTKDYVVSVRELDASNLSGAQTNWINLHTTYTHGYGFVAAAADEDVTSHPTRFIEKDIPPVGPLDIKRPQVYYGELLPDYSIVGAKGTPQEYDGSENKKVTYTGAGGVSLSSLFTRLALAVNYKQTNFLLNDAASADGAKIIFNRDPRQMVQKVAPYLKVDGDPVPFVDSTSGDIMWMIDGYTTMDDYPYSQRQSLSSLTNDSLAATDKTAKQPNDEINYIRNSVKATVDAYTGQVKLYQWDESDPVLEAWSKVFPGTLEPKETMPESVMDHIRYPEDLFEVQRSMLGTYHVDDPVTFYNIGDKWTVPADPNASDSSKQPPYYVLASDPAEQVSAPEYQLTTPMVVNGKPNLAAYVSVNSDPGPDYGKFTVLRVPSTNATKGPEQVRNILNNEPTISKDLSLFNSAGGGSTVVYGNLLTLPVGNSFLYVEPLYIQSSNTSGSFPILRRVLVSYGNKTGYSATLQGALQNLDDSQVGDSSIQTGSSNQEPSPTPTPPAGGSSGAPTSGAPQSGTSGEVTLAQVQQAENDFEAALKSGDQTAIYTAQAKLNATVQKYLEQHPPSTPTTSTGPASPSGGATPSK